MSESLTFSIQKMEYEGLDREIKRTMRRSARDAVQLGYMLRQMAEKKIWAAAFDSFDEYLSRELCMDYTMATRFMNINRKYSVSGDSMEIAEEYEEYSPGLLIEMLNMPPELEAGVTPDMTVKQVREIKKQAKAERKASVQPQTEEKETVIDGEYREIEEEEIFATSQPEKDRMHDENWFVRQYIKMMPGEASSLFEICRKEQNNSDRAKSVQKFIAPYGLHANSSSEYDFTFHGFVAGMDFRIGDEKIHLKYGRFVVELMKLMDEKSLPEEKLSAYGLPKTVYPEGSLITTVGCGHKYYCFSCAQDCIIRQKDRYCREAPFGNPFPCTTMHVLENIREEQPDGQCQFINLDMAEHILGKDPEPCCKNCDNESCGYRCQRSINKVNTEAADSDLMPKDGLAVTKYILKQENKILDDMLKFNDLPEMTVLKQKTIVAALAAMVCDLEAAESAPGPEPQPELPILKNNDQRKQWLGDYKTWGLWYRDENIDVNYYKYDFEDGSRLVVAEYLQRQDYWKKNKIEDEHFYHLLQAGKEGYGFNYNEKYRNSTDSETYLVDFLKNLRKKKIGGK